MSRASIASYIAGHPASAMLALLMAMVWIGGWIAILDATEPAPDARWYQRLGGRVLLFFIWPYIATCMNTDR